MTAKPGESGDRGATANLVARIIVSTLLGGAFVAVSAHSWRVAIGSRAIQDASAMHRAQVVRGVAEA